MRFEHLSLSLSFSGMVVWWWKVVHAAAEKSTEREKERERMFCMGERNDASRPARKATDAHNSVGSY